MHLTEMEQNWKGSAYAAPPNSTSRSEVGEEPSRLDGVSEGGGQDKIPAVAKRRWRYCEASMIGNFGRESTASSIVSGFC